MPAVFTGIVEGTGVVEEVTRDTKNRSAVRMAVDLGRHSQGLKVGQSVALNGVCLTATKIERSTCVFEMIDETVQRTDLGSLEPGGLVNIERSLKVGERLEGHFVLGHVDGVGVIREITDAPGETRVSFEVPSGLSKYIVQKGSIAVDGISLTVTDTRGSLVSVSLIPHTVEVTNFRTKGPGDKVNIETDILGKYIVR